MPAASVRCSTSIPRRTRSHSPARVVYMGSPLAEAERHVEILEFLFETIGRLSRTSPKEHSMATLKFRTESHAHRIEEVVGYSRNAASTTSITPIHTTGAVMTADELLAAYGPKLDELKATRRLCEPDVIDVRPETPNLDVMLKKFSSEHGMKKTSRLIVEGRGLFHIHPPASRCSP